jgi:hypothetical protein
MTEVKTNVSDTETVAGSDGRETVAEPLSNVSKASVSQFQPISAVARSHVDWQTIAAPDTTISKM